MNERVTTADRLREIMTEQNLKQADIIERAKPFSELYETKLTRPDLSQYCKGSVTPSQDKIFLLAAALNVNEAWLMGYDVPRQRDRDAVDVMLELKREWEDKAHPGINSVPIDMFTSDTSQLSADEIELLELYRKTIDSCQKSIIELARSLPKKGENT